MGSTNCCYALIFTSLICISFASLVFSLRFRPSDNISLTSSGVVKCSEINENGTKSPWHFFVQTANREMFEGSVSEMSRSGDGKAPSQSKTITCQDKYEDDLNQVTCTICIYSEILQDGSHLRQGQLSDLSLNDCMDRNFSVNEGGMKKFDYLPVCFVKHSACGESQDCGSNFLIKTK